MNQGPQPVDELFTELHQVTVHDVARRAVRTRAKYQGVTAADDHAVSREPVKSADGNPVNSSRRSDARREREGKPGTPQGRGARRELSWRRRRDWLAIPAEKQTLGQSRWVKFLLYDNEGHVRGARSFIPDDRHAQVIVRLKGNQRRSSGRASPGRVA